MQVTKINTFALRVLLRMNSVGFKTAGYTGNPVDGLILTSLKPPMSGLVGRFK